MQAGRNPSLIEASQPLNPGRTTLLASCLAQSLQSQLVLQRLLHRAKRPQHVALDLRKLRLQHGPPRMEHHIDVVGQFRLRLPDRLPHAPLDSIALDRIPQHSASRQAKPGSGGISIGWIRAGLQRRLTRSTPCELRAAKKYVINGSDCRFPSRYTR